MREISYRTLRQRWRALLLGLLVAHAAMAEIAAPFPTWGVETTATETAADDPAMKQFQAGADALRRGDLDAAKAAFAESSRLNPRMPQPLAAQADIEQRRGHPEAAKKLLDQALELAPRDAAVLTARAAFEIRRKDYPAAEAELKKATDANPDDFRARLALAELYADFAGRPSEAASAYREALRIDPAHAQAHHGLGMALAATGQFKAAESELRKSAELAPKVPMPVHSLGRLLLRQGQVEEGLASLDAALKIDSRFVPALLDKGDVSLAQGKADAALTLYEQASAAQPRDAAAQFKRGAALQVLARNADATQAYLAALELDPNLAPALNNLAWLAIAPRTELDVAATRAAKAVELAPDSADFRDTLGWVYRAQRKWAEAETVLEKAASMKPPMASVKYHLGVVYLDQKKRDMARQAFADALAIDPKHAESKAALEKLNNPS